MVAEIGHLTFVLRKVFTTTAPDKQCDGAICNMLDGVTTPFDKTFVKTFRN